MTYNNYRLNISMPKEEKEQLDKDLSAPQEAGQIESKDEALKAETGEVGGKVTEIAKTSAGETAVGKKGQATKKDQAKDDQMDQDRAALKAKLLKNAPPPREMRQEIEKKLLNQKDNLEGDVRRYKRKKNYHMLSVSLMNLRSLLRELEFVAKAGYDALKEIWLRVVHKFA